MSFVLNESKRELDFFHNHRLSVGPNLGPGAYQSPSAFDKFEQGKAAFGSNSRRGLQEAHIELL